MIDVALCTFQHTRFFDLQLFTSLWFTKIFFFACFWFLRYCARRQNLISPSATCPLIKIFVIPINQSDLRDKFTVYVKFRLTTRVMCFYIIISF